MQDAQEEFGSQQQDIASKILQKMAPMIVKYSQENGFGMIVDTSKPWPQSNVLWWGEAVDITKPVVEAYNVQSGVPAPTPPAGAAKPTTPRAPLWFGRSAETNDSKVERALRSKLTRTPRVSGKFHKAACKRGLFLLHPAL